MVRYVGPFSANRVSHNCSQLPPRRQRVTHAHTGAGFVPEEWKALDEEIARRAATSASVSKLGAVVKCVTINATTV